MSDHYSDPMDMVLDDDELEALMSGEADSTSPERDGNPVTSFFADARSARQAQPQPSPQLADYFAATPAGQGWAEQTVSTQSVEDPAPTTAGTALAAAVERAESSPPAVPQSLDFAPMYRASPLEAIANLLRPSGTKILMLVSSVLVLLIVGQALGSFNLFGSDSRTVAGPELDVAAGPTTESSVADTRFGAGASETTVSTLLAPTIELSVPPTVVTAAPATSPATTTTVESTTSVSDTTDPDVSTSETTDPSTTDPSTTDPSTPTSPTVPTTPTISITMPPTSDTTNPTLTLPTSVPSTGSTPPPSSVTIAPDQRYTAGRDIPVGSYRATVTSEIGCGVQIFGVGLLEFDTGNTASFRMADGQQVITTAGCPTVYQRSD